MEGSVMDAINEMQLLSPDDKDLAWPPDVLKPTLPEEQDDYGEKKADKERSKRNAKKPGVGNPEYVFVGYVIRKLLKVVYFRISAFCNALEISPNYPVASQTWVAFRCLLRHHVRLLSDRHVDQLLLCALYGVCKIMQFEPELSFGKIIDVYTKVRGRELGDRACQRVVRHIRLVREEGPPSSGSKTKRKLFGNVIHLYNQVFVPAMKNHLLQSKSLKKATLKLRRCAAEERTRATEEDSTEKSDHTPKDRYWPTLRSTVPIAEGNVTLNLRLPGTTTLSSSTPPTTKSTRKSKSKGKTMPVKKKANAEPKTRALYTFGEPTRNDLELVNRMVAQA